jgi:hypothetical protein
MNDSLVSMFMLRLLTDIKVVFILKGEDGSSRLWFNVVNFPYFVKL